MEPARAVSPASAEAHGRDVAGSALAKTYLEEGRKLGAIARGAAHEGVNLWRRVFGADVAGPPERRPRD
jgi:hypothetical protein